MTDHVQTLSKVVLAAVVGMVGLGAVLLALGVLAILLGFLT